MKKQSAIKVIGPAIVGKSGIAVVVVGLLVLATVSAAFGGRVAAQNSKDTTFTGSWRVTVTTPDGQTVGLLATYHADGTHTSSILPVTPPMPGGPDAVTFNSAGHGVIEEDGEGNAVLTIVHLRANADGEFLGTITIRGEVTLDEGGNAFSGQVERTITDPAGNVVQATTNEISGVRIVAETSLDATPTA